MKLDKYKENLHIIDDKVYSYDTHVATIDGDETLVVHGYWSKTTTKHINYVAEYFELKKVYEDYNGKTILMK